MASQSAERCVIRVGGSAMIKNRLESRLNALEKKRALSPMSIRPELLQAINDALDVGDTATVAELLKEVAPDDLTAEQINDIDRQLQS